MSRFGFSLRLVLLSPLLALVACGGEGAGAPASVGSEAVLSSTLAYTVSSCRESYRDGMFFRQEVRIREGEGEPVTVLEIAEVGPVRPIGFCTNYGLRRSGPSSVFYGAVQRFGVSPDGASVVIEVSDEFSNLGQTLSAEQKGFFVVRPDGTGFHKIAPASRERAWVSGGTSFVPLGFSPNGRRVSYPDRGPGPDGEDAVQIVSLDLVDGTRTQVTHLPSGPAVPFDFPGLYAPVFVDDETIAFSSTANPEGLNPDNRLAAFTVGVDDLHLELIPAPVVLPGSGIVPTFVITGRHPAAIAFRNPTDLVSELFLVDGGNLLQLTNYHRTDTAAAVRGGGAFLGVDGEHVVFIASADPLGTNPSENCQLFSIDRTGADLRQLTFVSEGPHSIQGCGGGFKPLGCSARLLGQDRRTAALVFSLTCEPFPGRNPYGNQLFAMNPDGSGLRQLTDWRGLVMEADGTTTVELGGPYAYPENF